MTPVLEVEGLEMHFGAIAAAQGVNVRVSLREIVCIIGPNGAGKTTFINLVTGYVKPQAGSIRLLGEDIVGKSPSRVTALGVRRSFQVPQLFGTLTVLENMLVALAATNRRGLDPWRSIRQRDRVVAAHAALDRFGLDGQADRPASELPEGGGKLLDVALAFALRPRLLLLDEPTSGVGAEDKFEVMDTLIGVLRESDVTTVFVEHDMDVVRRYADRVLVLSEGQFIADGDPTQTLDNPDIRRTVTGRA